AMLIAGQLCVVLRDWIRRRFGERREAARVWGAALAIAVLAGATHSMLRTRVWHDNDRLFHQAVIDSPSAYRAHYMVGAWAFENKRRREGETEYRKALNLFPYDPFLSFNMAEQYRLVGLCGAALPLYRWTFGLDAKFPLGHGMFAWCLLNEGHYAEARVRALDAIRVGADLKWMRRIIALADSARTGDSGRATAEEQMYVGVDGKKPQSVQKAAPPTNVHPRG